MTLLDRLLAWSLVIVASITLVALEEDTVHCPTCGRVMDRILGPVLERPKR